MKQRLFAFLMVVLAVASLVTVLYRTGSANLERSYAFLEREAVRTNMNSFQRVLDQNLANLNTSTADYAFWTATYDFMKSAQPEYLEDNYNLPTLERLSVHLVLLLDTERQVALYRRIDPETSSLLDFPSSLNPFLQAGAPLVTLDQIPSTRAGLILLPEGLMQVAAAPVLTSEEQGPSRGTLIFGRYLTPTAITRTAEAAGVQASVLRVDDPSLSQIDQAAVQELMGGQELSVRALDKNTVAGYALLKDLYNRPVGLIKINEARTIFNQGQSAREYLLLITIGAGLFFGLALALLVDWFLRSQVSRQASQTRYRHLVEQVNLVTYTDLNDAAATTIFISPQITALVGYTPEEWTQDPKLWANILHPEDRERVLAEHRRAHEHSNPFLSDYRMLARDGHLVWVHDEAVLLPDAESGTPVWQGVMSDITERKQAELATQYQLMVEQLLARISSRFVNTPLESLDAELQGALMEIGRFMDVERVSLAEIAADESQIVRVYEWHTSDVEPHVTHMEGLSMNPFQWSLGRLKADRLIRVTSLQRLPPEAAAERERWTSEGLKSVLGLPVQVQGCLRGFLSISSETEEVSWREENIRALRLISEMIGSLLARRWASEALADSEERFRAIFEHSGAGIGLVSASGELSSPNPALRALLRLDEQQTQLPSLDQIFPTDQQSAPLQLRELFEQKAEIHQVEQVFRRADGSLGSALVSMTLVRSEDQSESFAVLILEDISGRKLSAEELQRRQELFEAVNYAAEAFLQMDHFKVSMERALNRLGSVLNIDQVVVYQNMGQEQGLSGVLSSLCLPMGVEVCASRPAERLDLGGAFRRWTEEMSQRRVIAGPVSGLPAPEAELLRQEGILSTAVLPVWAGEQWWGLVRFDDCRSARAWSVVELDALQVAVRIFGAALHRRETQDEISKLYESEREQRTLAETLRRTAELLSQPLDKQQVLDAILTSLGEALPYDAANLMLLDGAKANILRAHGYGSHDPGGAHLVSLSPVLEHMLESGQGLVIPDTRAQTRWIEEPHMQWMRSYAGAPLKEGGRVIGFLNLHSALPNSFQPHDLTLLMALANQIAVALRNGSLYEETRRRGHQMALLNEITRASLQAETPEKLMTNLAGWMNELFGARGAYITLWDEAKQVPVLITSTPSLAERLQGYKINPGEGSITSTVLESGQAMVFENCRLIPGINPHLASLFDNESLMGLPLAADGRDLGAMMLVFPGDHVFQPSEMDLANQAAGQLSLALSKARLIESEQRRSLMLDHQNRLLTALDRVAARIVRVANLEQIMNTLGEELRRMEMGGLIAMRRHPDEQAFYTRYSFLPPVPASVRKQWDELISELPFSHATVNHFDRLFVERKPVFYKEIMQHTVDAVFRSSGRQTRNLLSALGFTPQTRAIYLPLISEDRAMGMLALWGEQIETGDVAVLELFASQVAIAIHNANLYAEIQRLAITDDLTGLYNRRGMVEVGQREVARALRMGSALSAAMIDIDHFKRVNDTYGHPVGNEVLALLAERLTMSLRGFDVVCRYGGEEFLVLLVESDLHSGVLIAERLRRAVESAPFQTSAGGLQITISLGVAELLPENDHLAGLIERADQALLKAKDSGRNRVVGE